MRSDLRRLLDDMMGLKGFQGKRRQRQVRCLTFRNEALFKHTWVRNVTHSLSDMKSMCKW